MFGNANQTLVCIHLHLRIADLASVAQPSEPDLDTYRPLGQVLAHCLNFNQRHWHSSHFVFSSVVVITRSRPSRRDRCLRDRMNPQGSLGTAGPIVFRTSLQAGTPSTGNPVSTD